MSTTNCVWDGNSQTTTTYDDELDYNNLWEPWKNIIISIKTATANISHLQKIAKRKNITITTQHLADALEDRNLLKDIITIQIASNGNFASIEFGKQEQMEQFCCEPLSIQGFNVSFYPERRKKQLQPRRLMNVSFINIPPETQFNPTQFVHSVPSSEPTNFSAFVSTTTFSINSEIPVFGTFPKFLQ